MEENYGMSSYFYPHKEIDPSIRLVIFSNEETKTHLFPHTQTSTFLSFLPAFYRPPSLGASTIPLTFFHSSPSPPLGQVKCGTDRC